MGTTGYLCPDQSGLGVEDIRIDLFQGVPSHVIMSISGGTGKAGGGDPVFLHGTDDLGLVKFGDSVYLRKALR